MSKKLTFERYHWFHNEVKKGKYPNAAKLATKFEISEKQAQRDIEFIRDRLKAPLKYDAKNKGYYYEDAGYEIPPIWFREDDLIAIILAIKLASTIPEKNLKHALLQVVETIIDSNSSRKININELMDKVSVKNIEYYKIDGTVFQQVLASLYNQKPIEITYYSPHKKEETERIIMPVHLLCYMGRWHLIAYCSLKKGLRNFAVSRIKDLKDTDVKIELPHDIPDIKAYINKAFGLLSNDNKIEVCLKFSEDVADWIKEQVWHDAQEIIENDDGSLCLKFPASDFRELKGEILKYGSSVKVIYPEELKNAVKEEIKKMQKNYE